ncbi:MAG: SGNH/GDSL hydrolase family protein [Eubacteriales bacterium]
MDFFREYISNIGASTSHNTILQRDMSAVVTFRAYFQPFLRGERTWRLYWQNTVDSTFADGAFSRADISGSAYRILSARLGYAFADREIINEAELTFDGKAQKDIAPDERFISDEIALDIPDGAYLCYTVTADIGSGLDIPCTPDSRALCYYAAGDRSSERGTENMSEANECMLPDMFAVKRSVSETRCFIGDSITQGCGTEAGRCEQWAARICAALSERDIGGWNLGLGYGRATDAAMGGAWLYKASRCDNACVCFGINDILGGNAGEDELFASLSSIISELRQLNPNIRVTVFTIPPFNLEPEREAVRRAVNARIGELGADDVFDIAAVLRVSPEREGDAAYGPHPNGDGGAAVAEEYIKQRCAM